MPRRKQDCPKRMKWEGEGESPSSPRTGEEGSASEETEGNQSPAPPTPKDGASSEPDSAKEMIASPLPSPSKRRSISPMGRETSISPRCPSRDCPSHESANPRCPSRDSLGSAPDSLRASRPVQSSPVSPTLRSSPPMVLTPPLVTPSGLVSPSSATTPLMVPPRGIILPLHPSPREAISPMVTTTPSPPHMAEEAVLDFSTKKKCPDDSGALNLSKSSHNTSSPSPPATGAGDSPLDLSVPRKRVGGGGGENHGPTAKKSARVDQAPFKPGSPWGMQFPFFNPNSLSPKSSEIPLWNGKLKMEKMSPAHSPYPPPQATVPSEATKALEKMTELSRLGGDAADIFRNALGAGGRPSAWQTHWLNKGAEQAKDVLKCVWCKQSFPSLAAMTAHMKEAKHCGVSVPNLTPPSISPAASISSPSTPISSSSHQPQPPISAPSMSSIQAPSTSSKGSPDLSLLIKETMPLPRKLVRGQDVWLGKGAEQTRQILKCMWCGQSFRSLAEMTAHMQQTQHYTNIISQEQIISWRSADDKTSNQSHVSAVLTCKVCDQAFSSLKELSNHMVKNSHYKEHIMRSITESGGRRRQTREKRKKSLPVRKLLELERAQNEMKSDGKSGSKDNTGRITCEKCGDKIETPLFVDHIRQCLGNSQRNLLKSALMSPGADPAESPDSTVKKEPKTDHSDGRPTPPEAAPGTTKEGTSKATNSSHKGSGNGSGGGEGGFGEQDSAPSVLNAIEKLIEKSFDSRARQAFGGTPVGSSILKRLGIDESVDYTKPLVDPQTMNFLRCYQYQTRERSGSESSAMSDKVKGDASATSGSFRSGNGVGGPESATSPAGSTASVPPSSPKSPSQRKKESKPPSEKSTPEMSSPPPPPSLRSTPQPKDNPEPPEEKVEVKREVKREVESPPVSPVKEPVGGEEKDKADAEDSKVPEEDDRKAAATPVASPVTTPVTTPPAPDRVTNGTPTKAGSEAPSPCPSTTSDRSDLSCASRTEKKVATPEPPTETPPAKKSDGAASSLSALSSMFDNLSGAPSEGSSHPLAALQKLCDKTESHASRPGTSSTYASGNQGTPGAILAFSWACNDAVMTDSIMKCAFCDTPFISKGAYRHHLSKMHFVKDGAIPDALAMKNQNQGGKASSTTSAANAAKSPLPPPANFEESPHSKFLKYTELAKQLSSKYV